MSYEIMDSGGDTNGRPDPGESIDLVATMKNFGSYATSVQVELDTDDPNITIIDGSADLGNVAEGESVDNSADPFSFEISADARPGSIVTFSVNATAVEGDSASDLAICIGRFDYLVWDPTGDKSSGPIIAATLDGLDFSGTIRGTLPMGAQLDNYATLWVTFGMYPEGFVLENTAPQGQAILDYMANGGNVYLEGGDTWAYDPGVGGFDFRSHFAISATVDGGDDLSHVLGVSNEFTDGMDFVYGGENSYVDHLNPSGNGFAILSNSLPVYNCAIAADSGTYRSVGASFEFGGLEDAARTSTKEALAQEIMEFFQVESVSPLFVDGFESGDTLGWSVTVQ